MQRAKPAISGLAAAALAIAVLAAACRPADSETIRLDGYPAPFESATDAANFVGTPVVLLATVQVAGEPRWNGPGGERPGSDHPGPEYIWTPVTASVDEVLRGADLLGTPELTVRFLGGSKDRVTVLPSDLDPAPLPASGARLVLFLNPPVDAGDGLVAATPNHVYTVDGAVATASNASHSIALAELVSLVDAGPASPTAEIGVGTTTSTAVGGSG